MEGQTLGKYQILSAIGRGAAGTVWRAIDPVIERTVAIKTIKLDDAGDAETAEEIARFKREAQAAGRLSHPNVVQIYDYGEQGGLAYLVMEYIEGGSLKGLIDKGERLPLKEIARVMDELLAALGHAHEKGIVHRDIKPANIMLTKAGQVKVTDFGIARIESSTMTQAGTVLGTPAYMSPEQFRGEPVDLRTDLYSAGVVLYQLLTGDRPFEGTFSAIMHKALNVEPPKPSEISVSVAPALDAVVARAMAKRPQARFASAAEFRAALAEAVRRFASAAMDVSDGLAGDLDKLCAASGVTAEITVGRVPLSAAAAACVSADRALLGLCLTGGDDYEILAAVPPHTAPDFEAAAAAGGVPVSHIGDVRAGAGPARFEDVAGGELRL
ncbi:MAG: protein kinase domain-containing protein, partial [Elioraea tepidiphila]